MRYVSLATLLLGITLCSPIRAQHLVTPLNAEDVRSDKQWQGDWIGIEQLQGDETLEGATRVNARYLRWEFRTEKKRVVRARAFVAAQGYYELYVDGQRIGHDVLAPIQQDFRKSLTYNVLNITNQLQRGKTYCVGLVLGTGRSVPMRRDKNSPFFGLPRVMVNVVIDYSDGTTQTIASDGQWKATADGAIRSINEYDGELYDATKNMKGWTTTGFDDRLWAKADVVERPSATLYPQTTLNQKATPLTAFDGVKPPTAWRMADGSVIVDAQQNIAGWISLRVAGQRGDTIRVRYAEQINADSTLYTANLRKARSEDIYVCNGQEKGQTWWHPTFVYHGFRYVQIQGMSSVTAADVQPYVVANDVAQTGTFVSSNETLNQIVRNAWWGILDNYKGFPVDCPQRDERQPWLGDRTVGALGESYLFDNNTLYTRWLRDICDAQREDGALPDVAPAFWNIYSDNVTWPAALPFICDMLYKQYDNDEAIRNSYPYIKKWVAHILGKYSDGGIITRDRYGDWCMPPENLKLIHSKDPNRKTDGGLLSTAYMIRILELMTQFAQMQGIAEEALAYQKKREQMVEAFNSRFLNRDRVEGDDESQPSAYYGNNTATANILPLAFGIVPEDCRKQVADQVADNILNRNGGHVACGVIGISHLLQTLTHNGYAQIAYRLATNTTYPSWGYMVEHGATTIWELWNGNTANPAMNSGNHVMLLGDLLTWCYQDLAGIRNAKGSVGYRQLDMAPAFHIEGLNHINASYQSPQGMVKSEWKKEYGQIVWTVMLPPGVTATCHVPGKEPQTICEGSTTIRFDWR